MPFCAACGQQTNPTAKYCGSCGAPIGASAPNVVAKKKTHGCVTALAIAFALLVVGIFLANYGHDGSPTTATIGSAVATDDAELLLTRCGPPTSDDSTAYDNPRPPIPSRTIEYSKQKLRFLFIPGDGAKVDDPPPYRWHVVGVTDMMAADPSQARVVSAPEAVKRMPCWKAK